MWKPLLLPLTLVMLAVATSDALQASARRGQDRKLFGVTPTATESGISLRQCQLLCDHHGCASFNYHAGKRSCEALPATACDSHTYYVERADGWSWYDVVADPAAESQQALWEYNACETYGICRDSCLRLLGETCRRPQQCRELVSGGSNCFSQKCQCNPDRWQLNSTHCLPRNPLLTTDGAHWVWKKILHGMCTTEFEIRSSGTVHIVMAEQYTHYSNRYTFVISQTGVSGTRTQEGVTSSQFASVSVNMLSGDRFRRLGIRWCGGEMRIWEVGSSYVIDWKDASWFTPTHLAIHTSDVGQWRFPEALVDPWFGDWSAERVYSIPRDTMMSRRRHEQDFWVEFQCRITRDCFWMARKEALWHNGNIWQVVVGGWDNTGSAVQRHLPGVGWKSYNWTSTPGILSASEFRLFRVHFSPEKIELYRGNETTPLVSHMVQDPFTINYDGPKMCCNVENIEYKLVQYDRGWSYEGGFRWGENL